MPRKASTVAGGIDLVFDIILYASVFFFVAIVCCMVYFAWKYRRRDPNQKTHPISGNARLEWIWTIIPMLGLFVLFGFGFSNWLGLAIPPGDSMEIRVNAKRWQWNFDYPRHKVSGAPELIVPYGRNIKLTMISTDVIHSFYVPEFRIKRDVLPNRYTVVWFHVPKKALTRLNTVDRRDLLLENVITRMAFAQDARAAQGLIAAGHIRINGKVERNASVKVKLNDRIDVFVPEKLKAQLLKIKGDYASKIKQALLQGNDKEAKALGKAGQAAFLKATPVWLNNVLVEMKRAKDAKAAVKLAESQLERFRKNEPSGTGNNKQKLPPDIQAQKVAKWTAALDKARAAYAKRYKLPEWLYADRDGLDGMWGFVSDTFNVFCTEYCGKEHSRMITRVRVVSNELFTFWLNRSLSKSPTGAQLLERYGCVSCHSSDGSANTGPTFLNLYGRKEVVIDKKDNKIKTLHLIDKDDKNKLFSEYIRESLLNPQAKIVKGFENQVMPTFKGQISEQHISIITDYIKFLKPKGSKK